MCPSDQWLPAQYCSAVLPRPSRGGEQSGGRTSALFAVLRGEGGAQQGGWCGASRAAAASPRPLLTPPSLGGRDPLWGLPGRAGAAADARQRRTRDSHPPPRRPDPCHPPQRYCLRHCVLLLRRAEPQADGEEDGPTTGPHLPTAAHDLSLKEPTRGRRRRRRRRRGGPGREERGTGHNNRGE